MMHIFIGLRLLSLFEALSCFKRLRKHFAIPAAAHHVHANDHVPTFKWEIYVDYLRP